MLYSICTAYTDMLCFEGYLNYSNKIDMVMRADEYEANEK